MNASVGCKDTLPSPSLPAEQSLAEQARERLLTISQADTGSGLQDMAKAVVGEKGVGKEEEEQDPGLSLPKEKAKEEEADQDEEFRKKLISISYDDASEGLSLPPPVVLGHGQPLA